MHFFLKPFCKHCLFSMEIVKPPKKFLGYFKLKWLIKWEYKGRICFSIVSFRPTHTCYLRNCFLIFGITLPELSKSLWKTSVRKGWDFIKTIICVATWQEWNCCKSVSLPPHAEMNIWPRCVFLTVTAGTSCVSSLQFGIQNSLIPSPLLASISLLTVREF